MRRMSLENQSETEKKIELHQLILQYLKRKNK
jgi:hypothetical protein